MVFVETSHAAGFLCALLVLFMTPLQTCKKKKVGSNFQCFTSTVLWLVECTWYDDVYGNERVEIFNCVHVLSMCYTAHALQNCD